MSRDDLQNIRAEQAMLSSENAAAEVLAGHQAPRQADGKPTGHNPPPAPAAKTGGLRFLTVAELREQTPESPPWLWDGYLAAGSVTLLAGKPKAGKSTLALAISSAIGGGASTFLGRAVTAGPVLYVSEEAGGTLRHKLPASDVQLHLLTRDGAWPKPEWPALVAAAVAHGVKVGARLLVFDTAAYWTALPAEREKDAGAVQAAVLPLVEATSSGLAVLLVHHSRKAGGEDGDAVRGSSGWAASVDTVLELERPGDDAPASQRLLLGLGRYPATPACILVDHDPSTGAWAVTGHAEDRQGARAAAVRSLVLDALQEGDSLTRVEIEEATERAWRDLLPTIKTLVNDGDIVRDGTGRKGDAYRYRKAVGEAVPQNPTAPTATTQDSVVCPFRDTTESDAVEPHRNAHRNEGTAASTPMACGCEVPLPAPDERGNLRCAECRRPTASWAA